jgi:hypothetical protein
VQKLTSGLTVCLADAACTATLTRAVTSCEAYLPCGITLHQFLAANPAIAQQLFAAAVTGKDWSATKEF